MSVVQLICVITTFKLQLNIYLFFETEETAQHTPGACSAECARAGLGIRPPLGPVPQVAPTLSREGRVLVLDARLDARTHGQQL